VSGPEKEYRIKSELMRVAGERGDTATKREELCTGKLQKSQEAID